MLFNYKYIDNHDIEKFQRYSDFLFLKVWSRARTPFESSKLARGEDLMDIYDKFNSLVDPHSWGFQFNKQIKEIYAQFLKLGKAQKKELRQWYKLNNKIEALFYNPSKSPITYEILDAKYPKLSKEIKKFYRRLYSSESPFKLEEFGKFDKIKKEHYREFFVKNFGGHEGICPFCGILHLRGNDHTKLEAYDHLISKGKYPFNSINFRNLAIMCNECNTSYKHNKKILFTHGSRLVPSIRRKAFYPYSKTKWQLQFSIQILNPNIKKLKKNEIFLNVTSNKRNDEVASWLETFGIEERYKAKLLSEYSGVIWYDKFYDGLHTARLKYKNPSLTYEEWGSDLIQECEANPFSELNFLKSAFYKECISKVGPS